MRWILLPLVASYLGAATVPAKSVLKLKLDRPLKAGMKGEVRAILASPVYDGTRNLAGEGAQVSLEMTSVAKEPRGRITAGGVASRILRPLAGSPRRLRVELAGVSWVGGGRVKARAVRAARLAKGAQYLWVRLEESMEIGDTAGPAPEVSSGDVPVGTRVRAWLERKVDSRTSRRGDEVTAILAEPVVAQGQVLLPAGARVSGTIAAARPARWLSRPGNLHLRFQELAAGGRKLEVTAAIAGVERERGTAMSVDAEGRISAGPQSKVRLLLQLGTSYVMGKALDDLMEEGVKAGLGAAAAGTAATAARYTSLAVGTGYFLLQRGREVELPEFTEVELAFGRAVPAR